MKNSSKKLLLSSMALGLAAVTTIGSGYAWFTFSGVANASGISMNSRAGAGLYVSLNKDTGYKTSVSLDNIFTVDSLTFDAATTVDGTSFYTISGTTNDAFNYTADAKLPGKEYLYGYKDASENTYVTRVSFSLYFALAVTAEQDIEIDLVNSSFTSASNAALAALRIGTSNTATTATKRIYGVGENNGTPLSGLPTTDQALTEYNEIMGTNVTTKITDPLATANTVFSMTETFVAPSGKLDDASNTANAVICPKDSDKVTPAGTTNLGDGYNYYQVDFNFWFEGNDYNCYTTMLNQAISGTLQFKLGSVKNA